MEHSMANRLRSKWSRKTHYTVREAIAILAGKRLQLDLSHIMVLETELIGFHIKLIASRYIVRQNFWRSHLHSSKQTVPGNNSHNKVVAIRRM